MKSTFIEQRKKNLEDTQEELALLHVLFPRQTQKSCKARGARKQERQGGFIYINFSYI